MAATLTEARDTCALAALLPVRAAMPITEAGDSCASAATTSQNATLALTEAADSCSVLTVTVAFQQSAIMNLQETGDTCAARANQTVSGQFALWAEQHSVADPPQTYAGGSYSLGAFGSWGGTGKHFAYGKIGDRWYKTCGDHQKVDPQHIDTSTSLDIYQDGRQEIFSFKLTDDDSQRVETNYWIPSSQSSVQAWNPDDAFNIVRGGEIVNWRSIGVITNLTPDQQPGAGYAVQVQRPCAFTPNTPGSGTWRDLGVNSETEFLSGHTWGGTYYAPADVFLVPCNDRRLLIKNGATFADMTVRSGGNSFDIPISGANSGQWGLFGAVIRGTSLYLIDWVNKYLVVIDMNTLLAWTSGSPPAGLATRVGNALPLSGTLTMESNRGFYLDTLNDLIVISSVETIMRPATGNVNSWQTSKRVDSWVVNDGGVVKAKSPQSHRWDSVVGGALSMGTIDFDTGKNDARFWVLRTNQIPSWVPAAGDVASISLNMLSTQDPITAGVGAPNFVYGGTGNNQGNVIQAWNSGGFASNFGPLGAYFICGGGDGDWWGNEVYVFPLADTVTANGTYAARTWKRINNPSTAMNGTNGSTDPFSNTTWGENGDGTPWMPHTYDQLEYLPPYSGSAGTFGSLILCTKMVAYRTQHNQRSHKCDLNTGAWSRASTSDAGMTPSVDAPSWCWNPRTRCFNGIEGGAGDTFVTKIFSLNFVNKGAAGVFSSVAMPSHLMGAYPVTRYWSKRDLLVTLSRKSATGMAIHTYDLNSPGSGATVANLTGDTLPLCAAGLEYVPHLNSTGVFFMRCPTAGQEQFIWKIEPPETDFPSGNWTVTKITMTGATVAGNSPNGMWKRFSFAPQINCLIWCSTTGTAVYAYNVGGL